MYALDLKDMVRVKYTKCTEKKTIDNDADALRLFGSAQLPNGESAQTEILFRSASARGMA